MNGVLNMKSDFKKIFRKRILPTVLAVLALSVCSITAFAVGEDDSQTPDPQPDPVVTEYVPDETKTRIIPFESLGGNGIVKGFPPDKVKIDGKEICKSIYIGICNDVLKGDVKAIIPYKLVKISE